MDFTSFILRAVPQTPLHFACMRGNEVAARDLLWFKDRIKVGVSVFFLFFYLYLLLYKDLMYCYYTVFFVLIFLRLNSLLVLLKCPSLLNSVFVPYSVFRSFL